MSKLIRTKGDADKVARYIDEYLNDGDFAVIAGERIEKRDGSLYIPARKSSQFVPSELAEFVIWPNRKAWNEEIRSAEWKSLRTWPDYLIELA